MRSFHPIHVLRMFSRNRFKALEFMKNLKAPGKCEASGEVKSRLYTQKGHLSHWFLFLDLPVYLHALSRRKHNHFVIWWTFLRNTNLGRQLYSPTALASPIGNIIDGPIIADNRKSIAISLPRRLSIYYYIGILNMLKTVYLSKTRIIIRTCKKFFHTQAQMLNHFGFHIENEGAATRSNLDLSYAVCRLCL